MPKKNNGWQRMKRQNAVENLKEAEKNLEKVEQEADLQGKRDDLEHKKYTVEQRKFELERADKAYLEGSKLYFDLFKTQATLTTGAIVAITALTGAFLMPDPVFVLLLWLSYASLLLSIAPALKTMDRITINVYTTLGSRELDQTMDKHLDLGRRTKLAQYSFYVGLVLFVVFAAINLATDTTVAQAIEGLSSLF